MYRRANAWNFGAAARRYAEEGAFAKVRMDDIDREFSKGLYESSKRLSEVRDKQRSAQNAATWNPKDPIRDISSSQIILEGTPPSQGTRNNLEAFAIHMQRQHQDDSLRPPYA
jgi:hypothetical protein